jgi:hypothetical protein
MHKIRFRPNSGQIKAEIIEKAGLTKVSQNEKKAEIRKKFGIREARNGKANLFESEWNNCMHKAKKATLITASTAWQTQDGCKRFQEGSRN